MSEETGFPESLADAGRPPRRALAVAGSVLLAVALLAGCGREDVSREEYVQQVAAALGEVDAALASLEAAEASALAAEAARARPAILRAAERLAAIEAPSGAGEAHELLSRGVRELASDVVVLASSAGADLGAVVARIARLPSLATLGRAQEIFEREGYALEVGLAGEPAATGP